MRLVVDAIAVPGGSAGVVTAGILAGWRQAAPDDDIVVLVDRLPAFAVPPGVLVEQLHARGPLGRLWTQSIGVRRACRRHRADGLVSALTSSAFLGARCPRGVVVYDLRHEHRPEQFSRRRRLARRLLYGYSFGRAPALFCISERTRRDVVAGRPELASKAVVTLLGADHAIGWRPGSGGGDAPWVLAFGHFPNKNVLGVLNAWRIVSERRPGIVLRICGLPAPDRTEVAAAVGSLGLGNRVELLPWLDEPEFQATFAGASAIIFPSDFEGFGLPAVEALLLGVPVVVSPDPALLEVTGGHAVVSAGARPADLADAIGLALDADEATRVAGQRHAASYTWRRTAGVMRQTLLALRD